MTQAKSGVRRAWVGFSALAFAICGVLLLIQFSGQMKKPTSAAPPPAPTPGAPSMPASETSISKPADPPQIAAKEDHPERGPARDEPTKPPTAAAVTNPVATNPPSSRRPEGHGASGKLGRTGAGKGAPAGYGAGAGALRDPVKLERVVPTAGKKLPAPPAKIRAPAQRVAPDAEPEVQPEEPAKVVRPSTSSPVEEKLSEGALKVNVPPSMTLGQSEHVRAVIGTKKNSALVDKEAALEANDGARVQIGRDLMISPLVRMELRSDNVGEFDINPLAPDATQRINDNDVTIWEWSVTPKLEGLHGLTLIVSDLKDGSRDAIPHQDLPRTYRSAGNRLAAGA